MGDPSPDTTLVADEFIDPGKVTGDTREEEPNDPGKVAGDGRANELNADMLGEG